MSLKLNLLTENPNPSDGFEYIMEEAGLNKPKNMYIQGPFMLAEGVNKNKRYYPIDELRREVARYTKEMIVPGRAMGELNHPPSAEVDLERACHIVTELYEEGDVFYGKSKVLNTPCGKIVQSLINDGVKVGISSRALGTLEESAAYNIVRNMNLVALDVVADPSFGNAIMDSILESKRWVLSEDGQYEEIYDNLASSLDSMPKKNVDEFIRRQIVDFISRI